MAEFTIPEASSGFGARGADSNFVAKTESLPEVLNEETHLASRPLLLINFESGGHHHMHVSQLVRHGMREGRTAIRFLLSQKVRDAVMLHLSPDEAEFFSTRVTVFENDPVWLRVKKLARKQSLAIWLYTEWLNYRERNESALVFLHLESALYPLALSPFPRFRISGLMFRPTFHYMQEGMLVKGKDSRWVFALKYVVARACVIRPGFRRIFLMDPLAEEYAISRWHTSKYQCVPDPLGPESGDSRPIASRAPISERPLTLLIAGALSSRKGIHSVVDALAKTSDTTRRGVRVHMVGKPDSGQADYVAQNIERLKDLEVEIVADLRFVEDDEMDQCMSQSHIVLAPYIDFKGSSGILIRAAHFGKPVLSTDRGLLGRLVSTRKLGAAIDTSDPDIFARCLDEIVATGQVKGFEPEAARQFADSCEPAIFAAALLAP